MLPQEVRVVPVLQPGTLPAADLALPPESPRKGLYIKPVLEHQGMVILPTEENGNQITQVLTYLGTPEEVFSALTYAYDHAFFDGITSQAWNATVTYYTTPIGLQTLAGMAKSHFGLPIGPKSLGSVHKLLSRTMQTLSHTLHDQRVTAFDGVNLDVRKDVHAEAFLQNHREAVQQPRFRAAQSDKIKHEAPDHPRRRASAATMRALRERPDFQKRLTAGIQNPERGKKISDTLRAKTEDLPSRRVLARMIQEARPLPTALQRLQDLSVDQQNVSIAHTLQSLQAHNEGRQMIALLTTLSPDGHVLELTPRLQGFLLMADAFNQTGSPIAPEQSTIDHVRKTFGKPETAETMLNLLQKRKRIYDHIAKIADKRFGEQPFDTAGSRRTTLTQPVIDRIAANTGQFIFGAAVAYSLHNRMEIMRHNKPKRAKQTGEQ